MSKSPVALGAARPGGLGAARAGALALLVFLAAFWSYGQVQAHGPGDGQELERPQYHVRVSAVVLPLFAVDNHGQPVNDLKKEELELLVNGRPIPIGYLISRSLTAAATESGQRVVLIIFDTLFNSAYGLERSRSIARALMKQAQPGDAFILLTYTIFGGLKYLAGPEPWNEHLERCLEKLPRFADGQLLTRRVDPRSAEYTPMSGVLSANQYGIDPNLHALRHTVKFFGVQLARLKPALKTITQPKLVYLISEGLHEEALSDSSDIGVTTLIKQMFTNLRVGAEALNEAGCILHVVNPGRFRESGGDNALAYLARNSGGRYFEGDAEMMLTKLEQVTAAYYEYAFSPPEDLPEQFSIALRCTRQGVKLETVRSGERGREYRDMDRLQKKALAVDAVTDGSWSRLVAALAEADYRLLEMRQDKGRRFLRITVPLPVAFRDRDLELFTICLDEAFTAADVSQRLVRSAEVLELEMASCRDKRRLFFLLIDPEVPRGIFRELK